MHSAKLKQKHKVSSSPNTSQFIFDAIGTHWMIDINHSLSQEAETSLLSIIKKRIEEFDRSYSRFRDDSLVMQISKKAGNYQFPLDFVEMISLYQKMYELTSGLMTPLIGNALEQAGYDKDYSLIPKEIKPIKSWEEVIEVDENNITVKEPVTLDFGALGKGYLIDIVGKLLEQHSIKSFCIDAGGDLLIRDFEMTIGFEHPEDISQVIGADVISNGSICASAGNRRKWANMHHIINPKTLAPVSTIIAVWVKAETAILADALTTALFFVEPEVLLAEFSFDYLIIYSDYSYKNSQPFPSELFVG